MNGASNKIQTENCVVSSSNSATVLATDQDNYTQLHFTYIHIVI